MQRRINEVNGIDTAKCIAEVHRRPLLWQDQRCDLKLKDVVDCLWEDVAAACDTASHLVRKKWKNLKDHFRKEYKKHLTNDGTYRPKWRHYDAMLFVKDFMAPNRSSPPPKFNENTQYSETMNFEAIAGSAAGTTAESIYEYDNKLHIEEPPKKKKRTTGDLKVDLLELENRKLDLLEKEFQRDVKEYSELQFFRSLLQHMENFTQTERLEVRAEILQVIIRKQNEKLQRQLKMQ